MSGKYHDTGCPIAFGLDSFGDRWSLLIVRDLMMWGRKTYGEFLNAGEGIATNVLACRLKHLEEAGVVSKIQDPENRRRNIYSLTEKGLDLAPLIIDIAIWSSRYDPNTAAPDELIKKMNKDRGAIIAEIKSSGCYLIPPESGK